MIARLLMVWLSPSKVPVNGVDKLPIGTKPELPQTSLPAASNVTPEPEALAGRDITKFVALVMDEMIAPAGMPAPEMEAPTKREAVLGTVIVVEYKYVIALSVVPVPTALMFEPSV